MLINAVYSIFKVYLHKAPLFLTLDFRVIFYVFYDYLFMSYFLQNLLSWIRIRMDPHLFYLLDPDPHSEKLLDPDPQKMNADPQPCCKIYTGTLYYYLVEIARCHSK